MTSVLFPPTPGSGVMTATTGSDALHLQFLDGRTSAIPYSFLRDHCRCRTCRSLLTPKINSHFQPAVQPEIIQVRNQCALVRTVSSECCYILAQTRTLGSFLVDHGGVPPSLQSNVLGVVIDWSDGHISKYSGEWLHNAAHDINFSLS